MRGGKKAADEKVRRLPMKIKKAADESKKFFLGSPKRCVTDSFDGGWCRLLVSAPQQVRMLLWKPCTVEG
jgi:hypothetical protein